MCRAQHISNALHKMCCALLAACRPTLMSERQRGSSLGPTRADLHSSSFKFGGATNTFRQPCDLSCGAMARTACGQRTARHGGAPPLGCDCEQGRMHAQRLHSLRVRE
jgi:hypothetical protein